MQVQAGMNAILKRVLQIAAQAWWVATGMIKAQMKELDITPLKHILKL